jgi:hypothetical protein
MASDELLPTFYSFLRHPIKAKKHNLSVNITNTLLKNTKAQLHFVHGKEHNSFSPIFILKCPLPTLLKLFLLCSFKSCHSKQTVKKIF